jgi:hypothetical protein
MRAVFKGRQVDVDSIDHGQDVCDSFVDFAYYLDRYWLGLLGNRLHRRAPLIGRWLHRALWSLAELGAAELEQLTDQLQADGSLYEDWFESQVDRAEDAYDRWRDSFN